MALTPSTDDFKRDIEVLEKTYPRGVQRETAAETIAEVRELAAHEVREIAAGITHRSKVLGLAVTIDEILGALDALADKIEP